MSKKETLNLAKLVTSVKNDKMIICSLRVQSVIFRNSLTKHSIRCEASIIAPPTSLLRWGFDARLRIKVPRKTGRAQKYYRPADLVAEMRLRRPSQDKGATQNRPCAEDWRISVRSVRA
jgi:hypothetical protein